MAERLQDLGLKFERNDNVRLMSKMAFGMFDTRKSHKCALCKRLGLVSASALPHHVTAPKSLAMPALMLALM